MAATYEATLVRLLAEREVNYTQDLPPPYRDFESHPDYKRYKFCARLFMTKSIVTEFQSQIYHDVLNNKLELPPITKNVASVYDTILRGLYCVFGKVLPELAYCLWTAPCWDISADGLSAPTIEDTERLLMNEIMSTFFVETESAAMEHSELVEYVGEILDDIKKCLNISVSIIWSSRVFDLASILRAEKVYAKADTSELCQRTAEIRMSTLLLEAVRANDLAAAMDILAGDATNIINTSDIYNRNPLLLACEFHARDDECEDMIKLLISRGADVNRKRNDGATALHFCKTPKLRDILIAAGAKP